MNIEQMMENIALGVIQSVEKPTTVSKVQTELYNTANYFNWTTARVEEYMNKAFGMEVEADFNKIGKKALAKVTKKPVAKLKKVIAEESFKFSEMTRPELMAYIKEHEPDAAISRLKLQELRDKAAGLIVAEAKETNPANTVKTLRKAKSTAKGKDNVKLPMKRCGLGELVELIAQNKRTFITATFVKKDGTPRTINFKYKSEDKLGYITVLEASMVKKYPNDPGKQHKKINKQTLISAIIKGTEYKVRA